jgi:hypothetical protein
VNDFEGIMELWSCYVKGYEKPTKKGMRSPCGERKKGEKRNTELSTSETE